MIHLWYYNPVADKITDVANLIFGQPLRGGIYFFENELAVLVTQVSFFLVHLQSLFHSKRCVFFVGLHSPPGVTFDGRDSGNDTGDS